MALRRSNSRVLYWNPSSVKHGASFTVVGKTRGRLSSSGVAALTTISLSVILLCAPTTRPIEMLKRVSFEATHRLVSVCEWPISHLGTPFERLNDFFRSTESLKRELTLLQQQNANLLKWQTFARGLKSENEQLKQQTHLVVDKPWSAVTSRVIQMQWVEQGHYLLIAGGSALAKNQPVITEEGVVGRVLDRGETVTRVLLITDIKSRIPVMVAGTDSHAILAGTNGELLEVTRATQQAPMKVGDFLVTSGCGGVFPAGLPVAEIVSVNDNSIYARPLAFPQGHLKASFVQVLKLSD